MSVVFLRGSLLFIYRKLDLFLIDMRLPTYFLMLRYIHLVRGIKVDKNLIFMI